MRVDGIPFHRIRVTSHPSGRAASSPSVSCPHFASVAAFVAVSTASIFRTTLAPFIPEVHARTTSEVGRTRPQQQLSWVYSVVGRRSCRRHGHTPHARVWPFHCWRVHEHGRRAPRTIPATSQPRTAGAGLSVARTAGPGVALESGQVMRVTGRGQSIRRDVTRRVGRAGIEVVRTQRSSHRHMSLRTSRRTSRALRTEHDGWLRGLSYLRRCGSPRLLLAGRCWGGRRWVWRM